MKRLFRVAVATLLFWTTAHAQNRLMFQSSSVKDGSSAFKKGQDPVVRMNRDCGIVGSGDETAALNTCIANLPSYTGSLQCDKPMAIHTNGVVVRDKLSIRIETAPAGHTLANYCQIVYTGSAGGTVIDAERVRDSVLFKGFTVYMAAADICVQTGQTGAGTNISTADSFEDIACINNNGRSSAIGWMIGDSTGQNNDEMQFKNAKFASQGCTKCGTAFKSVNTNVYGTKFQDIVLIEVGVGWNWIGNMAVDKANGYQVGLLYKLQGNSARYHIEHEDFENVDQILSYTNGDGVFVEQNGRVILNVPAMGWGGSTGTAGHPAWSGGNIRIKNMTFKGRASAAMGTLLASTGSTGTSADVDFYDSGIITYNNGKGPAPQNAFGYWSPEFLSGIPGSQSYSNWVGRGFVDEHGMILPAVGVKQYHSVLRVDASPCLRGNLCIGDGQIELTGVHSILNTPTIRYTGTAGSTSRSYAIVACDDTSCAVGHRSIPSLAVVKTNTQATLDRSNFITLTWTPALGANKYGILQQRVGSPDEWNLLMSNVSCSTNPCTVNITTDSSTYAWTYPTYNETGGVTLRGTVTGKAKATFDGISTGTAGSSNKAVCWKDSTHLGYCSTQPDSTGSCACN